MQVHKHVSEGRDRKPRDRNNIYVPQSLQEPEKTIVFADSFRILEEKNTGKFSSCQLRVIL